jgi:hypothetical protein
MMRGTTMGLQTLLLGVAAVLPAADAPPDVARDVERAVRAIQVAYNKGDAATLKGMMTEDHQTILTYARFTNTADQLKVLPEFKFAAYTIDGLTVTAVTKDVALVSYRATITGTYKGAPVPSPVQVAEVWVNRNGKWLEASYQETPLGGK